MTTERMEQAMARIVALAADLPEVTIGTSYRAPALKVADKTFVCLKTEALLVLMVPLEHKEVLLEVAPDIYFQTDHYKGWPALLVRLAVIGDDELRVRLAEAWRAKAPKWLLK